MSHNRVYGTEKNRYETKPPIRLVNGSITVEAAFVMPIVILAIFALLYLSLYLHDICRIQSVMDLALNKVGMTVKQESDFKTGRVHYEKIGKRNTFQLFSGIGEEEEKQIESYLQEDISKGLFLMKIKAIDVKADQFKIKINIETNTKVTLPGISGLFRQFDNTVVAGEYPVHNPPETIRCTQVILETGSGIKGVDQVKEKIEAIFNAEE